MNTIERDKLQEYMRKIEEFVPKEWTLKFGEWEQFKAMIEEVINEHDENEEAKSDLDTLHDDIDDVVSDLQAIIIAEDMLDVEVLEMCDKLKDAIDKLERL